jgi:ureidoacrylate peracid hydrolase
MLESFQLSSSNTALLVVDVQNDFCHNQGVFSKYKSVTLDHVEQAMSNLSTLIEKCREFDLPIIFIRTIHSTWTDSPSWLKRMEGAGEKMQICRPDSWGSSFFNVVPQEGDCVVTKHRYSAFIGTDLDLILKSQGIAYILVTGVATNVCVESTARDGYHRDYNVILIEDCCGAYDKAEHDATLNNINKFFGTVATSEKLLSTLEKVTG